MTGASWLWVLLLAGCIARLDLGSDRRSDGSLGPLPAPDGDALGRDAAGSTSTGGACDGGKTDCSGDCADLQSSLLHCGRCDIACAAGREICLFGACTPCVGGLNCGNACVHPGSDPQHCGQCDNACQATMICTGGVCK